MWLCNLFKKAKIVSKEVVYENTTKCEMWSRFYSTYNAPICTKIFKITKSNGNVEYKIKQYYAPIESPFYDGEYASNRMLDTVAKEEKIRALLWLESNTLEE